MSIIDYFPEFIAEFIERIWPVRVKSRLEAISLVANELEEVHGYNSYKYKPFIGPKIQSQMLFNPQSMPAVELHSYCSI